MFLANFLSGDVLHDLDQLGWARRSCTLRTHFEILNEDHLLENIFNCEIWNDHLLNNMFNSNYQRAWYVAAWTAVLAVGGPLLLPQVLHLFHLHYAFWYILCIIYYILCIIYYILLYIIYLLLPQVLHLLHLHYGQVHQGDSSICMITAMIHLLHFGCKLAESVKRGMEI